MILVWLTIMLFAEKGGICSDVSISNPCKKQILVDCIWWLFEPLLVLNSGRSFHDTSCDPDPWGNDRMWRVYFLNWVETTTYMGIQRYFDDDSMISWFDDYDDYYMISCASHDLPCWFHKISLTKKNIAGASETIHGEAAAFPGCQEWRVFGDERVTGYTRWTRSGSTMSAPTVTL